MNIVFMGTPEFAAVILRKLLDRPEANVIAAYTQPDRPAGRGYALKAPPVKDLALERGLKVFQPLNFKDEKDREELRSLGADLFIVAAYGLILPQSVLDMPRLGAINVHASLLPRYRGAAPIQRSIMNGDAVTGITIMQMEAGLDSGPILLQRAMGIGIDDTSATLHDDLANLGADLLMETLEKLSRGQLHAITQDHSKATRAPKLRKEEGLMDFKDAALSVHAKARGLTPWPGPYFMLQRDNQALKIDFTPGRPLNLDQATLQQTTPGQILGLIDNELAIRCADKAYAVKTLRPAGKKSMSAVDFANGYL